MLSDQATLICHDEGNPDEGSEVEDEFTPVLSSKIINKKVGDAEPTLNEYKALIRLPK